MVRRFPTGEPIMNRVLAFFFFVLFLGGIALVTLKDMTSIKSSNDESAAPKAQIYIVSGNWHIANTADSNGEFVRFQTDGSLSGFAGCNNFFGSYVATDKTVEIGPLASTRKACPLPLMNAESAFLHAIESAEFYAIVGDILRLSNASDEPTILRLEEASNQLTN